MPILAHASQQTDISTFRRIFSTFHPYWRRALLLALTLLAMSAHIVVSPLATKMIIDQALPHKDLTLLILLVLILIADPALAGFLSVAIDYLSITLGQYIVHDLRVGLYAHLQALSLRFYTAERSGEILSRLNNDVNGVQDVVTGTMMSVLLSIMRLLVTLVAMLSLNVPLTLLSLGLVPFFLYLSRRVGKARRNRSKLAQGALADVSAHLEETLNISGSLLVKSFGRQQAEIKRFTSISKQLLITQIRQRMLGRWFLLIFHFFFNIPPALVYYFGGVQVIGGKLSLGSLVAFTALQVSLFSPLGDLLNIHIDVQGALALFDRIFEYLDLPIEIVNRPDAIDLKQVEGYIRFRHVSFRYQPDHPALIDIDFEVRPGQLVALVGPSVAGKTTTTYLVPRLYDVEQGSVEIDGHDVRSVKLESLVQHIGMVTQETYLLNATIRDNIAYTCPIASFAEVVAAASAAQIHDRILELPDGYDTVVGPRGYILSGGEKQRIAIARVLLKNPRILILDEATSALDTRSERMIQAALSKLQAGRTTLAIAHRLSTVLAADLILVIDGGRIVERGTHDELLAHNGLYARLYHEQFR